MLKLEPPAESTKIAVSEWIAGVPRVPSKPEKENLITTIMSKGLVMSKCLCREWRRPREVYNKSRAEEGFGVREQFLPHSSMHDIYAGGGIT